MPRIPVAVAVLALTAAAVGWNMARYPAVWKMVQPGEGQTTTGPQSGKPAEDGAEPRDGDGHANATCPLGLAAGSETQVAAAPAPPHSPAGGPESILIIEQAPLDALAASRARAEPQSANPPAQTAESAFSPGTGTPAGEAAFSTGAGTSAAPPTMSGFEPISAPPSEPAVIIPEPSARVTGVSAVSISQGIARADGLPGGPHASVASNLPSGLLRLPRVADEQTRLPPLQWNAPGTPIPVYPSTGIE